MTAQATLEKDLETTGLKAKAGKYLTFVLGDEEYGLEILKVREINGLMEITPVPRTPNFVKGVINLRGTVVPVIDLRLKFEMPPVDYTEQTCIIVVVVLLDSERVEMGIVVDTVSEVLDIGKDDIEASPTFGGNVSTEYILGMGKVKNKVQILLNIDKVLSVQELVTLKHVQKDEG